MGGAEGFTHSPFHGCREDMKAVGGSTLNHRAARWSQGPWQGAKEIEDCMNNSVMAPSAGAALERVLQRLVAEITDGLRHGYFEFEIGCEIVAHDRRQVTLRAGKNHRFLIPHEECIIVPATSAVTPAIGAPNAYRQTPHIVPMTSARQVPTGPAGCELRVAHGERH